MAYLRRRSGGRISLIIYWGGRKHPKGLCTTDPAEAARIKSDVEEQLRRIRNAEGPRATQLLDEGFSIVDVRFGWRLRSDRSRSRGPPIRPNRTTSTNSAITSNSQDANRRTNTPPAVVA